MKKHNNGCAHCGGKLGLLFHTHSGLRFCRATCKDLFLAHLTRERVLLRKWLGLVTDRKR